MMERPVICGQWGCCSTPCSMVSFHFMMKINKNFSRRSKLLNSTFLGTCTSQYKDLLGLLIILYNHSAGDMKMQETSLLIRQLMEKNAGRRLTAAQALHLVRGQLSHL